MLKGYSIVFIQFSRRDSSGPLLLKQSRTEMSVPRADLFYFIYLASAFLVVSNVHSYFGKEFQRRAWKSWYRDSSDPHDVKFFLYRNRLNEDDRHEIVINQYPTLVRSGYNPYLPLVLLIHGALSDSETFPDVGLIKNEYLYGRYPVNIIMVDYGPLTKSTLPKSLSWLSGIVLEEGKKSVRGIAGRVAEFFYFLINSRYLLGPENVHIVAFSMGTNIASEAAGFVHDRTGRMIRRISGLDPAPNFSKEPWLTTEHAQFVDVTFTWLGYRAKHKEIGHVQFFMNGGKTQPKCPNYDPITQPYCSHVNAINYFAKSIRRRVPIIGCRCEPEECEDPPDDCLDPIVYGQNVPLFSMGDFYVEI